MIIHVLCLLYFQGMINENMSNVDSFFSDQGDQERGMTSKNNDRIHELCLLYVGSM